MGIEGGDRNECLVGIIPTISSLALRRLVILILGIVLSCVAETARACACCLPGGVIRGTSRRPLAQFLTERHVGFALELMKFKGTVAFEDREMSYESFDVTMSYADSVFTVRRSSGELVFVFAPDEELEVFMSNVADVHDAYAEWAFTGTIVSKDESLGLLLPTATLVIQGHQNMCFDPSRMVRWAIALETNDKEWSGTAYGDIQMDLKSWQERAYRK